MHKSSIPLIIVLLSLVLGLILSLITLLIAVFNEKRLRKELEKEKENILEINLENEKKCKTLEHKYKQCKLKEEEIKTLAHYDTLTGLPNRCKFMEQLNDYLQICARDKIKGAVLLIDLDNFKNINDTLGHDYGDQLLVIFSETLKLLLPRNWSIFRWGGDEFVLVVSDIHEEKNITEVLEGVYGFLHKPFEVGEKQLYISMSIGIVLFPQYGNETNELLKNADKAMYRAKANGKNRHVFYSERLHEDMLENLQIERALKTALLDKEMRVVYQPQFDLKEKKIVGLEALLRWDNKELGPIAPCKFIPVAEATGDIITIGTWVLEQACCQSKKWLDLGVSMPVAVNVSPVQFSEEDFCVNLQSILNKTELPAELLKIEITENLLMTSYEKSLHTIENIKRLGVSFALDDFGTGYSSLSYLRLLPITNLKIDKSFIEDICNSIRSKEIIDGIIQLAHKINLNVIAEGVETEEQLNFLIGIKCDIVQGYYFSKPKSGEEIESDYIIKQNIQGGVICEIR